MNLLDRLRIERAVWRYDAWLEYYDIYFSKRRAMRQELRTNLRDAAADRGAVGAVDRLGSIRALARESAMPRARQPRWMHGVYAAIATWVVYTCLVMTMAFGFADGVDAAGVRGRQISGPLTPFPGAEAAYETGADGVAFHVGLGWFSWALTLAAFLLAAVPWRNLRRTSPPAVHPAE